MVPNRARDSLRYMSLLRYISLLLQLIEQGTQHFDRSDPAITPLWPIFESAYITEGFQFLSGLCCGTPITTSSSPTAPPYSPPRYLVNGRAGMFSSVLVRDVKGHSGDKGTLCRLQQKCTFTTCHIPNPISTTVNIIWSCLCSGSCSQDNKVSSDFEHWPNRQSRPWPVFAGHAATLQHHCPGLKCILGTDHIWPFPMTHSLLCQLAEIPMSILLGTRHGQQRRMPSVHKSHTLQSL